MKEKEKKILTLGSLFDGIGAFPLAAIRTGGIVPIWASEIEKFPIEVTKHHFPEMVHLGDITKLSGADIPPVDIVTAGTPCQNVSVAGSRTGIHGEKSKLFFEMIRIVKEMRCESERQGKTGTDIQPRYLLWENVAAITHKNNADDFRTVIEEIVNIRAENSVSLPRPHKWQKSGIVLGDDFSIAYRQMDSQRFGIAQRRKRQFLICDFTGGNAPKVLFESQSLCGDLAEGEEQK